LEFWALSQVCVLEDVSRSCNHQQTVLVEYLPTDEQIADVLTKPLAKSKFEYFRDKLGEECPSC
jgi:hypothetical protein